MNDSAEILFRLLSAALGGGTEWPLPEGVNWQEVTDLAFDQEVAALLFDGIQRGAECSELQEDGSGLLDSEELENLRYVLIAGMMACEGEYVRHMEVIRFLTEMWRAEGLETYALKGVAFAEYYPVPAHRSSCDFDCNVRYAAGRDSMDMPAWKLADKLAADNGIRVDDSESKHSRYVVQGMSVENHRHVIGVNGSGSLRNQDAYLQGLLQDAAERVWPDLPLLSPCWLFNALFCIMHARTHFLEEDGIALKHVLDWVQIRKDAGAQVYREQFAKDIDRFGLRRFFDALDGVADYVMGVKQALSKPEQLMLEAILAPRNVRHFKSKFRARLDILRKVWTNRWKFGYFSDTSALATMLRYVYGHFFDRN